MMNRGMMLNAGSGSSGQATVNADLMTAFGQAVQAISAAGGQVLYQSPPQSARFRLSKKDFMTTGWMTVNYLGDLTVSPMGPRQSMVRVNCRPENLTPLIGTSIGILLMLALFNMRTGFFFVVLMLGAVSLAWQVYSLGSNVPKTMAEGLVLAIQMSSQGFRHRDAAAADGATGFRAAAAPGQGLRHRHRRPVRGLRRRHHLRLHRVRGLPPPPPHPHPAGRTRGSRHHPSPTTTGSGVRATPRRRLPRHRRVRGSRPPPPPPTAGTGRPEWRRGDRDAEAQRAA